MEDKLDIREIEWKLKSDYMRRIADEAYETGYEDGQAFASDNSGGYDYKKLYMEQKELVTDLYMRLTKSEAALREERKRANNLQNLMRMMKNETWA